MITIDYQGQTKILFLIKQEKRVIELKLINFTIYSYFFPLKLLKGLDE